MNASGLEHNYNTIIIKQTRYLANAKRRNNTIQRWYKLLDSWPFQTIYVLLFLFETKAVGAH